MPERKGGNAMRQRGSVLIVRCSETEMPEYRHGDRRLGPIDELSEMPVCT